MDLPKMEKDSNRCQEMVWERVSRWPRYYQCSRRKGYGPDGMFCKQHDPALVEARKEAADRLAEAQWQKRRIEIHGDTFYRALKEIANGHNDAKGLATEIINKFNEG